MGTSLKGGAKQLPETLPALGRFLQGSVRAELLEGEHCGVEAGGRRSPAPKDGAKAFPPAVVLPENKDLFALLPVPKNMLSAEVWEER